MSEILQKYKNKVEYLQNIGRIQQAIINDGLANLKSYVKGAGALEKALDDLGKRVTHAENLFQVEAIHKEFKELVKKVNVQIKEQSAEKGGGFFSSLGSLFGGPGGGAVPAPAADARPHERGGHIELVDRESEFIASMLTLLEGMSKGTLLMADEEQPFYSPLAAHRKKRFDGLKQTEADKLSSSVYNFFFLKSNEASLIESEREELKKIIGAMTGYIQSLAVSSRSFGGKLDQYSRKIKLATDLNEIKKIQHSILSETLEIQKVNNTVMERLVESEQRLNEANEKILRLERDLEMARQEKSVDALTQVYNRGYFNEALKNSILSFERYREPCSLIMFDIDHFKKFNDTYGHQAGDQVLATVAILAKESVRSSDTVARYGGEEFAVIVHKTGLDNAVKIAEIIRKNVSEHEFVAKSETLKVTVSLGVAEFRAGDTPETVIERADKSLYSAKEGGRNRLRAEGD